MKLTIDEFVVEYADQITLVFPFEKGKEIWEFLEEGAWDIKYCGPQPGTNMLQRKIIAVRAKKD